MDRVLRHTEGNQSQAANILGITRGSLRTKIREYGIRISQAVSIEDEQAKVEGELCGSQVQEPAT